MNEKCWTPPDRPTLVLLGGLALALFSVGCHGSPCEGGCLVDGVCHSDGSVNPTNPCAMCDAMLASDAFSAIDGVACDDGQFCTVADICAAGACRGSARSCSDGIDCNGGETCSNVTGSCQPTASLCANGQLCDATSGDCIARCPGCAIGGTCYGDGQVNPLSACQICTAHLSTSAWSANDGGSCDDGLFCTTGDVCTAGTCTGGATRMCDDGIACDGLETCDESADRCAAGVTTCAASAVCDAPADRCVTSCTGCVIEGICFGSGQRNPSNGCEVCAPETARDHFSPNDGARCDDGVFCTAGDVCTGTTCGGAARTCSDGIACNGVETCNESAGACRPGVSTCAGATLCEADTDSCVTTCTGCVIGGSCYGDGQINPANACEVCAVTRSASAWSANDGARCDDGLFCTDGDVCAARACAGTTRDCGDGVACNGAERCDEAHHTCTAGATTCATSQLCDVASDACVTTCAGCVIGDVCFAAGTTNPSNACEICDTARSRAAFSTNDGASCDDGSFCTRRDVCSGGLCAGATSNFCDDSIACNGTETCDEASDRCVRGATTCASSEVCDPSANACVTTCSGCVVQHVCYAPQTVNPSNQCEVCAPASSTSAWTPRTGASCDDGLFCTTTDTCSSSARCVGGPARACADSVSCNGTETCNDSTDRCDSAPTACTTGQVCDTATNACLTTCSGCVIGGICYAPSTRNPANQCQICSPASSASAWTSRTGQTCDDGLYCTTGESCSASAVCGGGSPRSCADAITCNGVETCNETTDRCDAAATTCTGGLVCDTTSNACVLSCSGGTTMCGPSCTNTAFNPRNCGACFHACRSGEACVSSACVPLVSYSFSSCGVTGAFGPSSAQCASAYAGTTLEGAVTTSAGIQSWLVPATGNYRIEAYGAQGRSAASGRVGGRGARVRGDFALIAGQRLRILVGQMGVEDGTSGGGGGGSFVADAASGTPMIVAGGGGGTRWHVTQDGCPGRVTTFGGVGSGSSTISSCDARTTGLTLGGIVSLASYGSAGAGFAGNGQADAGSGGGVSYAFINGGNGGNCTAFGGFGGGGSGNGSAGGGGGGGYSGGDGGSLGGGGGSFDGGATPDSAIGVQSGEGRIVIQRL